MFSTESNKHGFTPVQAEYIRQIDVFIRDNIDPILEPQHIILSETEIPPETNNKFPSSTFGTGYISSDGKYAVKIINFVKYVKRDRPINMNGIKEAVYSELINYHAISELCPKYFCKLIGYNYDYDDHILTIVMENCGIDLYEMYSIEDNKPKDKNVIRDHIYQLLKILECLHENNFVHFDLKLENIVIKLENIVMDNTGILKLIDAGSLTEIYDPEIYDPEIYNPEISDHKFKKIVVRGTKEYKAPELKTVPTIENNELLKATDIYSLGIIFIIMIFPIRRGREKIYNPIYYDPRNKSEKTFENIFELWKYVYGYDEAPQQIIKREFKDYFGDDISFEHFFSEDPKNRLTIEKLLSMFEEKMEADKIENISDELEDMSINYASSASSARSGKKGGKKTRRKRNNKSKRRQRKSRTK